MKISFSSYKNHLDDLNTVLATMHYKGDLDIYTLEVLQKDIYSLNKVLEVFVKKYGQGYQEIDW
jgi:hypothetical protein